MGNGLKTALPLALALFMGGGALQAVADSTDCTDKYVNDGSNERLILNPQISATEISAAMEIVCEIFLSQEAKSYVNEMVRLKPFQDQTDQEKLQYQILLMMARSETQRSFRNYAISRILKKRMQSRVLP